MFGGSVQSATCILWVVILVVGNMKIWVKEHDACRSGFSANHRCARRKGGKNVLSQRELTVPKFSFFWTSPVELADMILRVSVARNLLTTKLHCEETRQHSMFTLFTHFSLFKEFELEAPIWKVKQCDTNI